jgi:flavin reductase
MNAMMPEAAVAARALDQATFRKAMSAFATGVTVVAVSDGERLHAMTANAFLSASADPPLCLVSVGKRARMHGFLTQTERFGIALLAQGQEDAARHFAGQRKADEDFVFEEVAHAPVLAGAVAQIGCAKHAALDCGDHTLFVGKVIGASVSERAPLLYYRGAFRAFASVKVAAPAPEFW